MELYDLIMKCDKEGVGDRLDAQMQFYNKPLIAHYKNKYGYGFHTSVAFLRTGTLPGHDRQIMKKIAAEVADVRGGKVSPSFISDTVSNRIKKAYGIDFSKVKYKRGPYKNIEPTQVKEYEPRDSGDGVCMDCGQRFVIDAINHPTNLCVCVKCAPRGIHYGSSVSTGVSAIVTRRS